MGHRKFLEETKQMWFLPVLVGLRVLGKEDSESEDRHLTNKHADKYLIITEMQIKTTIRYRVTPVRMAIIKKSLKRLANVNMECRLLQKTLCYKCMKSH